MFGEKINRLPLSGFEPRIVQPYINYLKILISNFHRTNLIVVSNSRVAVTAAGQDSFPASNKIVHPLRFLNGENGENYTKVLILYSHLRLDHSSRPFPSIFPITWPTQLNLLDFTTTTTIIIIIIIIITGEDKRPNHEITIAESVYTLHYDGSCFDLQHAQKISLFSKNSTVGIERHAASCQMGARGMVHRG